MMWYNKIGSVESQQWYSGTVVVCVQEDHSMWMESLLFHTLPAPVGQFLHNYTMPFIGQLPRH